ncbi:MAG: hypothetical protein JWM80_4170, partial [Cyanobacteria bacterium RYN_339]|nr:hypothetical protein [Cyanobacteria bacterium RYN_339]
MAEPRLSEPWQAWLAENLMLGQPPASLLEVLRANDVPADVAEAELAAIAAH